MLQRAIAKGHSVCLSVHPSVCLSHSWATPTPFTLSKHFSHCTIERCF